MGNKTDLTTIEGMRKEMHAAVDHFLNHLKAKPDGTPVDELKLITDTDYDLHGGELVVLQRFSALGLTLKFVRPRVVIVDPGAFLAIETAEGIFRLANQTTDAVNAFTDFMIDVVGLNSPMDVMRAIADGIAIPLTMGIVEISRRTNLQFVPIEKEAVGLPDQSVVAETVPDGDAKTTNEPPPAPPTSPTPPVPPAPVVESAPTETLPETGKTTDEEQDLPPSGTEAELVSDVRAAEIDALHSKAEAREYAEKHSVSLDGVADKLADMKKALAAALVKTEI